MASSSLAAALGLGNIDVQSGLGEPLRAIVKLHGETKSLESPCFRLRISSDQYPASELRAQITLVEDGLGNTSLLIRSQQILNDPIVQLTLITDCENKISREYVLLLDPPLLDNNASPINSSAFNANAQPSVAKNIDQTPAKSLPNKEIASTHQTQTIAAPSSKPKKKPEAKAQSIKKKVLGANPAPSDSGEPRLVLSGSEDDYMRPDFIQSPLQLQMSLDLQDWSVNDSHALSNEEVSDEATAMANRLAYLETQMTALQQRNQELESLRMNAKNLPSSDNTLNWPTLLVYAFVTLVVIGFIGIAEWLRRRNGQRQIDAEVAIWRLLAPAEDLTEEESDQLMISGHGEADMSSSLQTKASNKKLNPLPQQATQPSLKLFDDAIGATVNEDILEQAEVFVAHGRANLAIVLLEDYLAEFPNSSPAPWLMLLDLLQRDGSEQEFEAAALECKRHFNVAAGSFHQPFHQEQSSIEDYPKVRAQLEGLWGTPEVIGFLDDLIFNRRLDDVIFNRKIETRTGFKRGAYSELLFLRSIAEMSLFNLSEGKSGSLFQPDIRPEQHIFEKTSALPSPVEPGNLFSEAPDLLELPVEDRPIFTQLPEDKSTPLDFEFEFKSKRD